MDARTILLKIKEGTFTPYLHLEDIDAAIKEIDGYKQKEFDYRAKCQQILSEERVAMDEQDDILRRFEFAVKDYLVYKGYVIGDGTWGFRTDVVCLHNYKQLKVTLKDTKHEREIFLDYAQNTKSLFEQAFKCFKNDQIDL